MPAGDAILSALCSSRNRRCLGLYAGAIVTLVTLAATGAHRRGLPRPAALALQSGLLCLALLGGLHVIDAGPAWRFGCGLATGHIAVAWMIAAGNAIAGSEPGTRNQAVGALVLVAGLLVLAAASPLVPYAPRAVWIVLALAGMAAIAGAGLFALWRVALAILGPATRRPSP
jgi:hypothetical protein